MLKVLQSICKSGNSAPNARNEDLLYYNPTCAAVIDGATSVYPTEYNATWFVCEMMNAFDRRYKEGLAAPVAIREAVADVYEVFKKKYTLQEYFPSAAGVFVFEEGDELCMFRLCDCVANVILKDGSVIDLPKSRLEAIDNRTLDRAKEIRRETGMNIREVVALPEIKQILLSNRKMMNRPDGYTVFSFNMPSIDERWIKRIPKDSIYRIILYSDGFSQKAEAMKNPDVELSAVYEELRREENEDMLYNAVPRFKLSDDCAAMVLSIE